MTKLKGLLAVTGMLLAVASAAWADDSQVRELMGEVQQLKAHVASLEAKQAQDSKQVAQTIDAVLRDAGQRSQLLANGGGWTAGWNSEKQQFFIGSEDGKFYLSPGIIFQARNFTNFRDSGKDNGNDDTENGFEIRRAKFIFQGNVFSKDISFKFQWQDSNNGGVPSLEWGYGQYTFWHGALGGDLAIRAGQFKDVPFKEEITGDPVQLMIERSLANNFMGGGAVGPLVQGVTLMLIGNDAPVHAELSFHDGAKTGNTDFRDVQPVTTSTGTVGVATDFGVSGRVDWKVFGDWIDTTDLTGKAKGKNDLLDIGAGFDVTQGDNTNTWRWTVDAQYQMASRWTIYGAIYGDYIDFRNIPGSSNRTDWGGVVEGGYFFDPAWQLVARYSVVVFDSDFKVNDEDTFHEIGVGVNWFMGDGGSAGNHAKVTADINYLPNGSPAAAPGLDYLASPGNDQWVLRLQFQLWF